MNSIREFQKYSLSIISILIVLSFFLGFYLNENSAGGGPSDFIYFVWPNLNFLKENIFVNIFSYNYTDSRTPLSYILHLLFNPLINSEIQFRFSVFLISLLCPILLFFNLKYRFNDAQTYLLIFLSSLILLSPYLRTSAFWGLHENYGIICALISYFLYQKYFFSISKKFKVKLLALISLAFFSSLCVYFDQKLFIIPLILFILIITDKKIPTNSKITLIILYTIFSLPFVYLIIMWENILPPNAAAQRKTGTEINLYNAGYASSIIFFYILPFLFLLNNKKKKIVTFIKSKLKFYTIIFFFYFLLLIFFSKFNDTQLIGQGIFKKLITINFENNLIKFIITIFIFFLSWIAIIFFTENSQVKNISKLFFYFLILSSIFIYPIFQEYFDPLIFVMTLTFLRLNIIINFKNLLILFMYLFIFLIFANYYYFITIKF